MIVLQDLSLAAQYVNGAGIIGLVLSCLAALLYFGIWLGYAAAQRFCTSTGWMGMHVASVHTRHLAHPFVWILCLLFGYASHINDCFAARNQIIQIHQHASSSDQVSRASALLNLLTNPEAWPWLSLSRLHP